MLLKDYYPSFLLQSMHIAGMIEAQQAELDTISVVPRDLIDQLQIDTATWGLDTWEHLLGVTQRQASNTERRTYLKSILSGMGSVTANALKDAAILYGCGTINVIESPNTYSFKIVFADIGIPTRLDDFNRYVETIKPAHLSYSYEITYQTHGALTTKTHASLATKTHTQIRNGVI